MAADSTAIAPGAGTASAVGDSAAIESGAGTAAVGDSAAIAPAAGDSTSSAAAAGSEPAIWRPSPRGAMLRSLAVPGWGQLYNGKWFKALLVAGVEIGLVANAIIQNQFAVAAGNELERAFYADNRSLSLWWLAGVILLSIGDAYVDAHLYQFDEDSDLSLASPATRWGLTLRVPL